MAAILAFASVGALFTQPILATENGSMIENVLNSALPTNNNNNNNNNNKNNKTNNNKNNKNNNNKNNNNKNNNNKKNKS